jgi:hypothetical protein
MKANELRLWNFVGYLHLEDDLAIDSSNVESLQNGSLTLSCKKKHSYNY